MVQVLPFGAEDLARTRFAISPIGHLVHGMHNSPCSRNSPRRQRWWSTARRAVPVNGRSLVELVNLGCHSVPAFLLPSSPAEQPRFEPTLDDELDLLAATPLDRIRAELLPRSGAGGSLPRVARELLDGQSRALRHMVQVVRDVFKSCMSDDWPDIRRRLHRDLNHRSHVMMVNGTGAVLRTLHPTITWESGHLLYTVPDQPPVGSTANQGFVLKPCAFGSSSIHPVTAPGHPPVLIYPCREDGADRLRRGDSLSVLLGAGRARALRAIDGGCSTAELARRLYVGPPTASAHAVVLRSAGLITTERDGQRVRHELTLLGSGLLAANPGGNSMDS